MKKEVSITQREVIEFAMQSLYHNKQVFIDLEMGFGKTLVAANLLKEIVDEEEKRILYICPTGLIPQVSKVFAESFSNLKIDFKSFGWFQNLEFVKSQLGLAKQYDIVIVDEAHKIKSFSNSILAQAENSLDYYTDLQKFSRGKFPYTLMSIGVLAFIAKIKYRVFMSGTAMPLGAVDIFNFLWLGKHKKLISNIHSRQESFFSFCNTYCTKKQSPGGVSYSGFKKRNFDMLLKNLSDCYIRREHADEKTVHLKIPTPKYFQILVDDKEKNYIQEERIIEIMRKHYNVNNENFLTILKSTPQFAQMMALRRAVGISKVKQVLKHAKKVGKKAIYFFQFREASQIFFNEIHKKFKNCYHVTGELSIKKTSKLVEYANTLDECILVATMGKAGTGFDCNGFSTIAFVELDMNFATVEQACGRILRKGITHTPRFFFFSTETGVDKMIVDNLLSKNFKRFLEKK